jgi:putative transposase
MRSKPVAALLIDLEVAKTRRCSRSLPAVFRWYNHEHRHGGIGWMAPASVHDGTAAALTAQRAVTLNAAFAAHPVRFKERTPKPPVLPSAAWINSPTNHSSAPAFIPARTLIS